MTEHGKPHAGCRCGQFLTLDGHGRHWPQKQQQVVFLDVSRERMSGQEGVGQVLIWTGSEKIAARLELKVGPTLCGAQTRRVA
jgi:hypothetical protein